MIGGQIRSNRRPKAAKAFGEQFMWGGDILGFHALRARVLSSSHAKDTIARATLACDLFMIETHIFNKNSASVLRGGAVRSMSPPHLLPFPRVRDRKHQRVVLELALQE